MLLQRPPNKKSSRPVFFEHYSKPCCRGVRECSAATGKSVDTIKDNIPEPTRVVPAAVAAGINTGGMGDMMQGNPAEQAGPGSE